MTTDTPMAIEVNCATGEQIVRPLTETEIAQRAEDAALYEAQKAEQEAAEQAKAELKASAKAKLVAGEALTAEEAETLVI
jgi:hypothetical protein